jgi:NTP pyrophosphatase (non-canonical NTP hydrolase)
MNFAQYVPLAIRTCKELSLPGHINHMALGVMGEMGEIIDQIKKAYIYGKDLDQVNIVEEVGDVAWYVAGFVAKFDTQAYMGEVDSKHPANAETLAKAKARVTRSILGITHAFSDVMSEIQMAVDAGNMEVAKRGTEVLCAILYALAKLLDVDLEQAFDVNIAKLAKRYGDKYSDYAAINRDLAGERAVLEAGTSGAGE